MTAPTVAAAPHRVRGERQESPHLLRIMTPRRIEVLVLAANGHSNAEIADLLFVSADTVARHLQKVYMVLGARDRSHAVALGIKRGFIRPDQVRSQSRDCTR